MENKQKFLADLLGHEVYLINEETYDNSKTEPLVEEEEIEYSGSNSKGVIVIIEENVTEEEMDLLDNILSSVNLSRNEVALFKKDSNFNSWVDKLQDIASTKVISFGVNSGKSRLIDIDTKYAPATIEGRSVVIADSLSMLMEQKELKRKLWKCLQEIF